jgi:serine/threonine-protein kinase
MPLTSGTKLGRYEIRSKIGEGGMGEVYQALDTELDRIVAIKTLPKSIGSNQQRLHRFIQEAKAASALNHPHILTIHEIGTVGNSRFIAMEFIDGETLRKRMTAGLKPGEALEFAIQISSALAAAHVAGIIHRDIKPENVMVRGDGYVKVLDFGLAKLIEPQGSQTDPEAPTKAMVNTGAGTVLGTANYMSPEQAKGTNMDARTDIWSLGVVLYEMVAGHLPFRGATPTETISLILQRDAAPLTRFVANVPPELERIVNKALTKDREERYQTMKDLLIDLRALKRKLEVDAEIDRTLSPELRQTQSSAAGSTASGIAAGTISKTSAPSASSAEYIVTGIRQHKVAAVTVVMALVVGAIGLAYYLYARNTEVAIDSIAVLPFQNAGGDPNIEYLSDGISESLINSLSQIQRLRVIARSTAFRFKAKDIDPQQVGRELNVRSVLTGRVRQAGDRLNIQVDLVDTSTGAQLWGEEYERHVADALAIKQSIAREITEKLRLRLSGNEQEQLARRDTTNTEAYQFYLRGRYYWNKRTADGLKKAIEEFQHAVERDPNYALGYVGLADCYLLLEQYAGVPSNESLPKAKAAADRALQIDESLAEAHTSLAKVHEFSWQWAEADKEYRRAISLNSNYPTAHHWYSIYLRVVGRFSEAAKEIDRAFELDPLSPVISINVSDIYTLRGDFDAAIERSKKTIELYPDYPGGYETLAKAYAGKRQYSEAIAELSKAVEVSGRASWYLSELGYCYALAGKHAEALAILKEMEARYAKRETNAFNVALLHLGLGNKDRAFAWLEKDFETRNGVLEDIAYDPYFSLLRDDPRYADLLRRMGLKP